MLGSSTQSSMQLSDSYPARSDQNRSLNWLSALGNFAASNIHRKKALLRENTKMSSSKQCRSVSNRGISRFWWLTAFLDTNNQQSTVWGQSRQILLALLYEDNVVQLIKKSGYIESWECRDNWVNLKWKSDSINVTKSHKRHCIIHNKQKMTHSNATTLWKDLRFYQKPYSYHRSLTNEYRSLSQFKNIYQQRLCLQ